jgi:hypothetical protein
MHSPGAMTNIYLHHLGTGGADQARLDRLNSGGHRGRTRSTKKDA